MSRVENLEVPQGDGHTANASEDDAPHDVQETGGPFVEYQGGDVRTREVHRQQSQVGKVGVFRGKTSELVNPNLIMRDASYLGISH